MNSGARDIFTIMDAVDKCMPAFHPARDAGWDRELARLKDMATRFAPEIRHLVWAELSQACRVYVGPHEASGAWPARINQIMSGSAALTGPLLHLTGPLQQLP